MSNSDSDLSELDDYAFDEDEGLDTQDNIEAEEGDDDVSMSDVECKLVAALRKLMFRQWC